MSRGADECDTISVQLGMAMRTDEHQRRQRIRQHIRSLALLHKRVHHALAVVGQGGKAREHHDWQLRVDFFAACVSHGSRLSECWFYCRAARTGVSSATSPVQAPPSCSTYATASDDDILYVIAAADVAVEMLGFLEACAIWRIANRIFVESE